MKTLISTLIFILTSALMASPQAVSADVPFTCQIKLADLSRFQEDGESQVNKIALFDYLVTEQKILLGPVHYLATQSALESENLKLKKLIANYPLYTQKQQMDFAEKIWKNIVDNFNPTLAHPKLVKDYRYTKPVNPLTGFLDVDQLKMSDIDIIKELAQVLGFDYHSYLKNYEITQAIDKNPEVKKVVVEFIVQSMVTAAKMSQRQGKKLKALTRMKALNGGWYNNENSDAGFMSFIGNSGAILGSLFLGGTLLSTPHVAPVVAVSASAATAAGIPILYSGVRGTQIAYQSSILKIRSALEKRRARKLVEKSATNSDHSESEE